MLLIFLDMDGVLNSAEWDSTGTSQVPYDHPDRQWLSSIDPAAVQLLNQVILATKAKVCISSAWRCNNTPEEMQSHLNYHGFIGEVIGRTPRASRVEGKREGPTRGDEILQWLVKHAIELHVEAFVVLDDMHDLGVVSEEHVHTPWATGLKPKHLPQIFEVLGHE